MDLFSGMTDDQTAVIGCAMALAVCGGLLALTSTFGRHRPQQAPVEVNTLKFPATAARSRRPAPALAESEADRRAA
jgi:hypothetical protein